MAGFQAPSTASFGVGSDESAGSIIDLSPQRVTAGGLGAPFPKVAVPATSGTEDPLTQHAFASGGLDKESSQHKLVWSVAETPRSDDMSWIIEVTGAMGSATPKNGKTDSSDAGSNEHGGNTESKES